MCFRCMAVPLGGPCSGHIVGPFLYMTEPRRWEAEGLAHGHRHHHGAQASGPAAPYLNCSQARAPRDKGTERGGQRLRSWRQAPEHTLAPPRKPAPGCALGPEEQERRPDKDPPGGSGRQNLRAPETQTCRHFGSAKVGAETSSRKPVIISAASPAAPRPPQRREHSASRWQPRGGSSKHLSPLWAKC